MLSNPVGQHKYYWLKTKGTRSRITEKSRLATAAAAIVRRIMILSKPLVLLLELPCRKGSTTAIAAKAKKWKKRQRNLRAVDDGKWEAPRGSKK